VWTSYADISRVSLGNVPTGPHLLAIAEWYLGLMRAGGVPDEVAALFVDRLALYVDGDAFEGSVYLSRIKEGLDIETFFTQIRDYFAGLPADRFPVIASMVDSLTGPGDDERFEFGLDLLVRGLASYADADADADAARPGDR
jgi:hypothetical protein